MTHTIQISPLDKTVSASDNDLLADKIIDAGIDLSLYCSMKGLCGKCFVEIASGFLPPLEEREKFLLHQNGLKANFRLACLYRIKGDLSIKIPESSLVQETSVLRTGISTSVILNPSVKKYHLQLKRPEIASPLSSFELLQSSFQDQELKVPLSLLRELPRILDQSGYDVTLTLFDDREILHVEPGDKTDQSFGIAVDTGTTTVVTELVNLTTGKVIDALTATNPQVKYGADVVSRIGFSLEDSDNLKKLKNSIGAALNKMTSGLLERNRVDPSSVFEIVVAGNTAMNHFLLGIPVDSLAKAPFNPVFSRLDELDAREFGFQINKNAKLYIAPNIKSFIGGDISAGLIASSLAERAGNFLFIDLGTNGEIVLKTDSRIVATSTAAGPAFEGMTISCGMLAIPGAIDSAKFTDRLEVSTIGNKPPLGVCGTGLIDLLAVFLEKGWIERSGAITKKVNKIPIVGNIHMSQKDIREIQLAAAAIKAGVKMMLREYNMDQDELNGIFIAGAFGSLLNIKNAMSIGLVPRIAEDKITFIGNSSLAGARALLLSRQAKENIKSLVERIQFVSLASDPNFQHFFIEALELSG